MGHLTILYFVLYIHSWLLKRKHLRKKICFSFVSYASQYFKTTNLIYITWNLKFKLENLTLHPINHIITPIINIHILKLVKYIIINVLCQYFNIIFN